MVRSTLAGGKAYEEIRHRIVTLDYAPGERLSEKELADELGISRTPVREAILLLRQQRLVEVYPQRGTLVAPINVSDVYHAQFVREAIECTALARVDCESIDAQSVKRLQQLITRQRTGEATEDVDFFFANDDAFHRELLKLSGQEEAWGVVHSVKGQLDRARRMGMQRHPLHKFIDQHEDIASLIVKNKLEEAIAALRAHLREILTDVDCMLRENPETFSGFGVYNTSR